MNVANGRLFIKRGTPGLRSRGLLADTLHNFGDAATAMPLPIAFWLARKKRGEATLGVHGPEGRFHKTKGPPRDQSAMARAAH